MTAAISTRADGVLRIRESKFGKSRLVPLDPSAVDALERYDHTRERLLPRTEQRQLLRLAPRHPRDLRRRVADTPDALRARRGRRQLAA